MKSTDSPSPVRFLNTTYMGIWIKDCPAVMTHDGSPWEARKTTR